MKPTLRANLTVRMTALLAGTLLVVGLVAAWQAFRSVNDLSDRIIRQTWSMIDVRVATLLDKAKNTSKLLSGLIAPATGTLPTLSDANSFQDLASKAYEVMSANEELSSIRFTLERTGEHVMVVRRPNGSLVIQTSTLVAGGSRLRKDFVPFGDTWRTTGTDPHSTTDFRTTNWFKEVKATSKQFWTETYVLRNLSGPDTPGVTYATPVFDRFNRFLGVLTVDFTIADLSRFVETVDVGTNGYVALIEYGADSTPKVIAHPQANRLVIPEGVTQRLATIYELDDTVLRQIVEHMSPEQHASTGRGVVHQLVIDHGKRYQTGTHRVGGDDIPDWVLAVIVPDENFMSGVWQTGVFLVIIGAVALLAVLGLSFVVAQRVADPLQKLVVETERVRAFDLEPRPVVDADVREIDELGNAMEQMKSGLRSLEKLVPSEYARWLIATGQEARLGGERRHITTYFGDIIGFTALSEKMEPEDLVEVLAEYLDVLSSEVIASGGTVDKFNGDDVMAFWGAPNPIDDHAFMACKSAIASQKTLAALHNEWKEHGRPIMRASFGISTGDVIVGNVGSRQRMNYTVIGDAVNLASRLQALNKYYSTEILLGPIARQEAGDRIVARMVDWVSVVGRDEPVRVFELLALREEATPDDLFVAEKHNEAMDLYRMRQWQSAIVAFAAVLKIRPHDGPARILLDRCEKYLDHPPPDDWNGSVQVSIK
ncbi:MAG: adenylate/guanylate cyclase domain-containing protein [Armatimonadetes bacterium]|nr:adenylate/guanylate cyclase domain-containing protein [Armatimonadota bacterium]